MFGEMHAINGFMMVFLILVLTNFSKSYNTIDLDSEQATIRACGSDLAKLLQLVCNSRYIRPHKSFLEDMTQGPNQWDNDYGEPLAFLKSSFRNRIRYQELSGQEIGKHQANRDCCDKPCTIRTVKLYCGV